MTKNFAPHLRPLTEAERDLSPPVPSFGVGSMPGRDPREEAFTPRPPVTMDPATAADGPTRTRRWYVTEARFADLEASHAELDARLLNLTQNFGTMAAELDRLMARVTALEGRRP